MLELNIDEELWSSLEQEAERQEVSMPQMVEHVALYFAAEVNSGRAAARILDGLDYAAEEEAGLGPPPPSPTPMFQMSSALRLVEPDANRMTVPPAPLVQEPLARAGSVR